MHIQMELLMLVELQQAGGEIHRLCVGEGLRQIENLVVLAEAVLVEVAVRVVEENALGVGILDRIVLRSNHSLFERGRILEGEALLGPGDHRLGLIRIQYSARFSGHQARFSG